MIKGVLSVANGAPSIRIDHDLDPAAEAIVLGHFAVRPLAADLLWERSLQLLCY
jgi:hypothetical protein